MESNDPERPAVTLNIEGPVENFVTVMPPRVTLSGVGTAPMRQSVIIEPEPRYPFKVTAAKARSGEHIRFRLDALPPRNGAPRYRLIVENVRVEKGRYYDTITLETDSPHRRRINIHVYGNVVE